MYFKVGEGAASCTILVKLDQKEVQAAPFYDES